MPKRKKEISKSEEVTKSGKYELLTIVHPEIEAKEAVSEVETLIVKHSGKILETSFWDKRTLAFPIKKQISGSYVLFVVELPKNSLEHLRTAFKLNEKILRTLWTAVRR